SGARRGPPPRGGDPTRRRAPPEGVGATVSGGIASPSMELTAAEGRVLGCLIEQEAADPGAVPLTLNALRLSCHQTTGRDPVVAYDDRTVEDTLLSLKSKGLARFVAPTPEVRATRYRHRADDRWRMGPGDLAVLAVILLGGEQSVSEVRARAQA